MRQYARFLFLKLDPAWRRLAGAEQADQRREFGDAVLGFRGRLMLRSFSLVGTRGDADLVLWQVADQLEAFQALQTTLFSTRFGAYLSIGYSYLGMARRSIYQFPDDPEDPRVVVRPQDSRYLFVYPFVKTREWYRLPLERRQEMMEEHVRVGRRYPSVRLNTLHSFGLDDQEFLLAFETDDPGDFLGLVMDLRETAASSYTLRDTPIFTCLQMSLREALDALGGFVAGPEAQRAAADRDGFVPVARTTDLPLGAARRVYAGTDAIALFNVGGRIYAVSDRCTHGRASLSEGSVDRERRALHCPWHGGQFDLATGTPLAAPARVPLRTYRVKLDGENILVG